MLLMILVLFINYDIIISIDKESDPKILCLKRMICSAPVQISSNFIQVLNV